MEVKRYWEVVDELKADSTSADVEARAMDGWAREDKYQWRTNCEWLVGVSKRKSALVNRLFLAKADETGLTAIYKLPVPALSIFPDATPRYCMIKL